MRTSLLVVVMLGVATPVLADVDPQITDALKKVKAKDYPSANTVTILTDQSVAYQPDGQFSNTWHQAKLVLTAAGGALFLASDTLLALEKFGDLRLPAHEGLVMATYASAQALLAG